MNKPEFKAMIITVGGSPKPLIESIKSFQPRFVCFVASQETVDLIAEIKKEIDFKPKDHKVIIEDINDITRCYQNILNCALILKKEEILPKNVIADITGGTKVMSAALVLLAITKGYSLNYTGGTAREKGGVGQVISGSEVIFQQANPWEILLIEDRKKIAHMFNAFQFEAALTTIDAALENAIRPELKYYLGALRCLAESYFNWDKFNHKQSCETLEKSFIMLKNFADISRNDEAKSLIPVVENNLNFIRIFKKETSGFQEKITRSYLIDLLSNARRRAKEGKYDDGVARLYRSLELTAQIQLKCNYNITSGKVSPEKVPIEIKDEFVKKYLDPVNHILKLPLQASFRLLETLGDTMGTVYKKNENEMKKLLDARNTSILAHGLNSLNKQTFDSLWLAISRFSNVKESELIIFPSLSLQQ